MRTNAPLESLFARTSLLLLALGLGACSGAGAQGDHSIYKDDGRAVAFEAMVDDLAQADVVFLGEEHDNDVGHALQLATLEALHARRPNLIVTLEQFEADVQSQVDLYLAGAIDEATFLAGSRPWGNYAEHYRPILEYARTARIPVIAANVPRPLARRVAYEGLEAVDGLDHVPWSTWTGEPEYGQRFAQAMGRSHMAQDDLALQRWFAAQCVKDDMMAESIARAITAERVRGGDPLVVHLCGKFHSNYRLGTVSRLLRRLPSLDVRVVGMNSGGDLERAPDADEQRVGDYLWRVPEQG